MKRKTILLLCLLISTLLIGCQKTEADINDINTNINNLLLNLPDDTNIDTILIDQKKHYQELNLDTLYEQYLKGDISEEELKKQEKNQNLIKNSSDKILPKELNYSFYKINLDVPEKITLNNIEWNIEMVAPIVIANNDKSPAIMMYSSFNWTNDEEKEKIEDIYNDYILKIINELSPIIAGDNYKSFDLSSFNETNADVAMIFEGLDCYIVVSSQYYKNTTEDGQTLNTVMLSTYYLSKYNKYLYNSDTQKILDYIESNIFSANFKYYYKKENGVLYEPEINNDTLSSFIRY